MKRVYILSNHPLFGKCIETLLGKEAPIQIVGHQKDPDLAMEHIRALQPDVVIVDSNESEANRGKIIVQVMKEGLKTRVVGLSLRDNSALVCHGEQKTVEALDDFVGMIVSGNDVAKELSSPSPSITTQDRWGRTLDYLRISVTDRCNLRCVYCMPPEGVPAKPREAILHSEEIARVVEAAAGIGFRSIRITGGEPLLRKNIVGLVRRIATIPGIDEVTMTTNATLLSAFARDLADAGLKRVNISLDSLRPERFRRITRMGNLESARQGIAAVEAAGLTPLKINMVVIQGFNDDEVPEMARLTLDHPWHVRFIEVMPIAGVSDWGADWPGGNARLITAGEIQQRLQTLGTLAPDGGPRGHGPARYYRLPNAQGTIGFISPISEHHCASCNRLRLTADGYLRSCLFADQGVYCKAALADGASLSTLQSLIRRAAESKPPQRPSYAEIAVRGAAMSLIGG